MISPRWRKVLRDPWGNKARTLPVILSIAVGVFAIGMIAIAEQVISRDLTASWLASRSILGEESGVQVPGRRQVVLERASLDYLQAGLGDTVAIEIPGGKRRQLQVVGTVHDLDVPDPIFTGRGFGYVNMETLEWLGQDRTYNELGIVVAQDSLSKIHIRQAADAVRSKDVAVHFDRPYRSQQLEYQAALVLGVTAVESWGYSSVRRIRPDGTESDDIFLIAPPPGTKLLDPIVLEGRWLLPDDENAIVINTEMLRDEDDVAVGEKMLLKIDGRETLWHSPIRF